MDAIRRGVSALVITGLLVGTAVLTTSSLVGATTVSTEAELRLAFANDDLVELSNDITLTDCTGGGALERTIASPVVVEGNGFTLTQTCADNVIVQNGAGLLTVRNLTVAGGQASGSGGGIFAFGDLIVERSTITNNAATQMGGGIAADGALTVTDSTVDSNNAGTGGGGIAANLVASVTNSTVSNNTGGGIMSSQSSAALVTIVNSTITGNAGVSTGGGINSGGLVRLVYVTLVDNDASIAFANLDAQRSEAFATVVATTNLDAGNCETGPGQISFGYNFSSDDLCGFNQPTDRSSAGDPGLGALGAHGGPTLTRLPDSDSPLVGAIPDANCHDDGAAGITTDQRGIARPQSNGCDIGAVEVEIAPLEPVQPPATPIPLQAIFTG